MCLQKWTSGDIIHSYVESATYHTVLLLCSQNFQRWNQLQRTYLQAVFWWKRGQGVLLLEERIHLSINLKCNCSSKLLTTHWSPGMIIFYRFVWGDVCALSFKGDLPKYFNQSTSVFLINYLTFLSECTHISSYKAFIDGAVAPEYLYRVHFKYAFNQQESFK